VDNRSAPSLSTGYRVDSAWFCLGSLGLEAYLKRRRDKLDNRSAPSLSTGYRVDSAWFCLGSLGLEAHCNAR